MIGSYGNVLRHSTPDVVMHYRRLLAYTISMCALGAIVLGGMVYFMSWSSRQGSHEIKGTTPSSKAIIRVIVHDDNPYHVFEPGKRFSVEVTLQVLSGEPPDNLGCQWRDYTEKPLSDIIPLRPNQRNIVPSPDDVRVGYYGLYFLPEDVEFLPMREIGFAVLPEVKMMMSDPSSPFGVVHMDVEDPYLGATWIKTLTDLQFSSPFQWRREMDYRRRHGRIEIPLVIGGPWRCDNTRPISKGQLMSLRDYLVKLFSTDPNVPVWELGLEENLAWRRNKDEWAYYWQNLVAKLRVAREAKDMVNPNIKIAYQIAELDFEALEEFFRSGAADLVDILSLHPYKWPNFETPETWHDQFIQQVRKLMQKYGRELPIWYTEVGAPQNDAGVPQMYSDGHPVRGLTRREEVAYMIKIHVLALRAGVEKIIWYNYRDAGHNATDVEDHFGLRDYWGFPKPVYVAYANLINCLRGKRYKCTMMIDHVVQAHVFSGEDEDCFIVWTYPPVNITISLADLDISKSKIVQILNAVGTPLPVSDQIGITSEPIYVIVSKRKS